MKLKLHFYPEDILLDLEGLNYEIASLPEYETSPQDKIIKEAIKHSDIDLAEFLSGSKKPVFIVNDRHRPTPTAKILSVIQDMIPVDSEFIVAVGTHPAPGENEQREIFGELYDRYKDRITVHDAYDENKLVKILESRFGFDLVINKRVADASHIVAINSTEPHYFAGWSGGRKSFLPGVSSYDTITENHKFSLSPDSQLLKLNGNPVHDNMQELADYINKTKHVFSFQVVTNIQGEIFKVFAGSLENTFHRAVREAQILYTTPVDEKADIVISVSLSPQDEQIARSFKALDSGALGLKDDGILVLVCSAHKGIGNNELYADISKFTSPVTCLEAININSMNNYKLGLQRIHRLASWGLNDRLWIVTNCDHEEAAKLFFHPFDDLNNALDKALSIKGKEARILVLPQGNLTFPLYNKG
ncbi:nickel-dependent lactate racemase [bacterium]|nr:nickel-dependent lactate racemase [bacterium]